MSIEQIIASHAAEVKIYQLTDEMPDALYEALYDHYLRVGDMPYGVAKARTGDPYEWVSDCFNEYINA